MKFAIVLSLFVVAALGAPQNYQDVQVLRYENEVGIHDYNFLYELSDGTKREERGELKNIGTENEAMSVAGSYSWPDPDGVIWTVTFVADENGFQPKVTSSKGRR